MQAHRVDQRRRNRVPHIVPHTPQLDERRVGVLRVVRRATQPTLFVKLFKVTFVFLHRR